MFSYFSAQSSAQSSEPKYNFEKEPFSKGSYGKVYKGSMCLPDASKEIKKVVKKEIRYVANDPVDAIRLLREITILRMLGKHESIITLLNITTSPGAINLIFESFDTDLYAILRSVDKKQNTLSDDMIQFFVYQLLSAVGYMHSAQVVHRDLKPGNILVRCCDCHIKLIDFGLARVTPHGEAQEFTVSSSSSSNVRRRPRRQLTQEVVALWYRSPELLLAYLKGGEAPSDMWSVGCILAELLLILPLFHEKTEELSLSAIFNVLGDPKPEECAWFDESISVRTLNSCLSQKPAQDFNVLFSSAPQSAVELLKGLIVFNPYSRLTAEEALQHRFFASLPNKKPFVRYSNTSRSEISKKSEEAYRAFEAELDAEPSRKTRKTTADKAHELIQRSKDYYNHISSFNTSRNFFTSTSANESTDTNINTASTHESAQSDAASSVKMSSA